MFIDRVYFQSVISELPSDLEKGIAAGDFLKASVVKVLKDRVILDLKGMLINAKTEIDLTTGEELILKFDGVSEGQLILRKVKNMSATRTREIDVVELLQEIGITVSKENINIANKLLEYKLPINKEMFNKAAALLHKLGLTDESLDTAMHLLKGNILFTFLIPLYNISGELFNSKVLVLNEKQNNKNKIDLNNTKICFKIETKNIGMVLVELDVSDIKIRCMFSVEKDEIIDFLKRHIYKLEEALNDIGYLSVETEIKPKANVESPEFITDNKISRIDIKV
ncbi:MAG TPA: hypothetical protein GXZ31_05465 [Thermoanaerobacterales bacterium]|nr:hypothetical protein [Thermoanaerobacterales bacterium]